jgi:hypothetical protein
VAHGLHDRLQRLGGQRPERRPLFGAGDLASGLSGAVTSTRAENAEDAEGGGQEEQVKKAGGAAAAGGAEGSDEAATGETHEDFSFPSRGLPVPFSGNTGGGRYISHDATIRGFLAVPNLHPGPRIEAVEKAVEARSPTGVLPESNRLARTRTG